MIENVSLSDKKHAILEGEMMIDGASHSSITSSLSKVFLASLECVCIQTSEDY
jgi:hypothetical protein